jgi:hypothetical protein
MSAPSPIGGLTALQINKQFRTGELKQRDINQGPPPGWKLPGPRQLQVGGPLVNPDGSDFEEAEEAEG